MKTYVFHSYRHESFRLAGKLLRGNCWLELSEAEVASLSPEERDTVKLAKARREITVHPMSNGRPIEDRRELVVESKAPVESDTSTGEDDESGSAAAS